MPLLDSEALQAGARGVLRKSAEPQLLLSCLRSVAAGKTWVESATTIGAEGQISHARALLTPRERQVLEFVTQGHTNKQVALSLGISPGTVKIHMKHIFGKTGVQERHGLILNELSKRDIAGYAQRNY
jgi:DNA-binding NarL/FixJ family response regulator